MVSTLHRGFTRGAISIACGFILGGLIFLKNRPIYCPYWGGGGFRGWGVGRFLREKGWVGRV